MTPEQHARAKEIFLAACERPAEQRAAFLEQAIADDGELKAHVHDLLRHHIDVALTRTNRAMDIPVRADNADVDGESATPACRRSLEPGAMVAERYRVVSLLGRGGMGEVYRADDFVLGQPVALKFLPMRFSQDSDWLDRFMNEARIAREITHRNICRIYDVHFDEVSQEPFISMEYIEGEDLGSLIGKIGRLPPEKALDVARQVCTGLAAAHAKGILHRDLKPANVMIDRAGRVRITDFGLSAKREQIASEDIRCGTPAYMAPELFAGTDVSIRSDIYALGLILYEMFTGRPAFSAESSTAFAELHQRRRPQPPGELVPDLPDGVDSVIQQCLEKDPQERPSSALAVAAALPGSDPLALALSAGVTPSAEAVADSSGHCGLRTSAAMSLLCAAVLILVIVGVLAKPSGLTPELGDAQPPSVLAERARRIAEDLGPAPRALSHSFGFTYWLSPAFNGHSAWIRLPEGSEFAASDPSALKFWYRQSNTPLSPSSPLNITFGHARTTLTDPHRTEPGMVTVVMEQDGRLLGLEALPVDRTPYSDGAPPPDWSPLFSAADLDPAGFVSAVPTLHSRVYGVEPHAWVRDRTAAASTPVRVEAASVGGKPLFFALVRDEVAPIGVYRHREMTRRRTISISARIILLIGASLVALPLARANLSRGRGDRRGALRLSGFVLGARLVVWTLTASHAHQLRAELVLFLFALLGALLEAGLVWVFYVALEPYVRRYWPQTVVAWSRVLAGRVRDQRVARDMLIGALVGVTFALLFELDQLLPHWIGLQVRNPLRLTDSLESLLGARYALAALIRSVLAAIYYGLLLLILLVFARSLLRRTMLAAVATALVAAPMFLPLLAHPVWSLLPLGIILGLALWALTRYGLVVLICAILVMRLLLSLPLTFSPGAWGWDMSLMALAAVVGIATFGFVCARGNAATAPLLVR